MENKADVMAGPIGDTDLNPDKIPRTCPNCGILASTGSDTCPNCGASLKRKAMKILAQGITEESIKDLENALAENGVEQSKIDDVLNSLREASPSQENPVAPEGQENAAPDTQNPADTAPAERELETAMKPLKPLSRKRVAQSYDSSLVDLQQESVYKLDQEYIEAGWVITPFSSGTYAPVMERHNFDSAVAIFSEEFPEDFEVYRSQLLVRAFDSDGSYSAAGARLQELMYSLTQYPLLNDDSYQEEEYEEKMNFITGLRPYDEYLEELVDNLPDSKQDEFYRILFGILQDNLMTEDNMGYLSVSLYPEPDIDSVFEEALDKMGIEHSQLPLPLRGASRRRAQRIEDLDEGLGRLEEALMGLGDLDEGRVLEEFGRPQRRSRPPRKDPNCKNQRKPRRERPSRRR